MQAGYFDAAWSDVKGSPGLPGKLLALVLISLIPVFGWIVVYGYLLGWARDLSWGVRAPLPARIFENADGEMYRRGFFALVISFLYGLLPFALLVIFDHAFDMGRSLLGGPFGLVPMLCGVMPIVFAAAALLAMVLSWVGMMRMSIYRRLAPGLQLSRIWAMLRYDGGGILRIVGMSLVLVLCAGAAALLLLLLVAGVASLVFFVMLGGMPVQSVTPYDSSVVMLGFFVVASACLLYTLFVSAAAVFTAMIVVRSLGYWMQKFDVAHWRGQDDPMPFELAPDAWQESPGRSS